jgi:hypothetical protein
VGAAVISVGLPELVGFNRSRGSLCSDSTIRRRPTGTHRSHGQVRAEVTEQARAQQKRVADGVYSVANEAARIADQGGESGPVTQVVRDASDRMMQAGQWLQAHEPGHVLDEVKSYARRHPGVFLLAAAALGVMAGRMAKNAIGETSDHGTPPAFPRPRRVEPSTSELRVPSAASAPQAPSALRPVDAYPSQPAGS